ncbi:MAG: HAD family hydrolase [Armatimonadota bacterium]|jgi:HAD superfamily hydrolase (TIGR01509 family)
MAMTACTREIRYVWFDQDDTLYNYQDAMRRALSACLGLIHDRFSRTRERLGAAELMQIRREISGRPDCATLDLVEARCEAFRETLDRYARPDDGLARMLTETYFSTLRSGIRPFPGVVECLRTLGDEGYVLGILSNGISYLDELSLAGFFDHSVYAMETLLYKPDAAIFAHAMSVTGARPEQCLLVGDSHICDVLGAREAGWAAVWLNRDGRRWEIKAEPPELVVEDFAEIPSLIAELNVSRVTSGERSRR